MNKTNIKAIIVIAVIVIILGVFLVFQKLGERVPENDLSVTGNTSGNLTNGGYFAESNGTVYFANSYDNNTIYSMDANETNLKKITSSASKNLLVGGDFLYYYMDTSGGGEGLGYVIKTFGVYRSTLKGKKTKCLDREAAVAMQLVGNYIYFERYNNKDYTKTYKIKIDKSDMQLVSDMVINPVAAYNGTIYFNGTENDHYLYALDTRSDTAYTVYQGDLWYPQYANGYIYYMDVSSNYRLCRFSLSTQQVEVLTNDRVDMFNVGDYNIYYQRSDQTSPCLMRINLDGSNPEIVALGIYNDINLTSQYAYFREYGDSINIYHTPLYGQIRVERFSAAEAAAIENRK